KVVDDALPRSRDPEAGRGQAVEKTARVFDHDGKRGPRSGPEERALPGLAGDLHVDVERELSGPAGKRDLSKARPAVAEGSEHRGERAARQVSAEADRAGRPVCVDPEQGRGPGRIRQVE